MNATFGFAIVGALARLLRPLGLGPLAGADPELGPVTAHEHLFRDEDAYFGFSFGLWHRHAMTPNKHPYSYEAAHPGQDPDG